jgi:integrase
MEAGDEELTQAALAVEAEGSDVVAKAGKQEHDVGKDIILGSMAPSTRRGYDKFVSSFKAFRGDRDEDLDCFKDWMIHLYTVDNMRASTIKTAVSFVRRYLEIEQGICVATWRGAYQLLKGMSKGQLPDKSDAFPREAVREYLAQGGFDGGELVRKLVIAIGFYGGLRSAELVPLEFKNVTVEDVGLKVHIDRAKTDQAGRGDYVYVLRETSGGLPCPVAMYERYCACFEQPTGRLFRQFRWGKYSEQPIGKSALSKIIKEAAASLGLKGKFTPHSLRSGMATSMAESGANEVELQKHGRWESAKVAVSYVRNTDSLKVAAARKVRGEGPALSAVVATGSEEPVKGQDEKEAGSKGEEMGAGPGEKRFVSCAFHRCSFYV